MFYIDFLKDLVTPQRFNEVTESYLSRQTESADNIATQDPFIVRCNEENDSVPIDPNANAGFP